MAIGEIQEAMGLGNYDKASQIAEERLGQSSLKTHGAYENSKFMPRAMQELGNQMHRSASQFAIELQNASATGDVKPALLALSKTTQACVSCHAGVRIKEKTLVHTIGWGFNPIHEPRLNRSQKHSTSL